MTELTIKPIPFQRYLSWVVAAVVTVLWVVIYVNKFLPAKVTSQTSACSKVCKYDSDCRVVGCSKKLTCQSGKCQMPKKLGSLFYLLALVFLAIVVVCFSLYGLFMGKLGVKFTKDHVEFHSLFGLKKVAWDEVLGLTFHAINTRWGQEATVYTITCETIMFSFIAMEIPSDTMTRELDVGSFMFAKFSKEDTEKVLEVLSKQANIKPEYEHEW